MGFEGFGRFRVCGSVVGLARLGGRRRVGEEERL